MRTGTKKSEVEVSSTNAATGKTPDIASTSVPDTLAELKVNLDTGLSGAEVDTCRKEHGYNEIAEHKEPPL